MLSSRRKGIKSNSPDIWPSRLGRVGTRDIYSKCQSCPTKFRTVGDFTRGTRHALHCDMPDNCGSTVSAAQQQLPCLLRCANMSPQHIVRTCYCFQCFALWGVTANLLPLYREEMWVTQPVIRQHSIHAPEDGSLPMILEGCHQSSAPTFK